LTSREEWIDSNADAVATEVAVDAALTDWAHHAGWSTGHGDTPCELIAEMRREWSAQRELTATKREWTRELPTEPGWYWVFMPDEIGLALSRIESSILDSSMEVTLHGTEVVWEIGEFEARSRSDLWWLGPLAVPEVPK
jgi:hypothetical protein